MKQLIAHPFHTQEGPTYAKAVGDTMDWWRWVGMVLSNEFYFCNRRGQAAFWVALGLLPLLFPNSPTVIDVMMNMYSDEVI